MDLLLSNLHLCRALIRCFGKTEERRQASYEKKVNPSLKYGSATTIHVDHGFPRIGAGNQCQ
jgi:hypothetical protein